MDCQWQASAQQLAAFAEKRFVNRSDCFGGYRDGQPYTSKVQVTQDVLLEHFNGTTIIGMHAISKADMCKWVAWDFDNHTGDQKQAEVNQEGIVVLMKKLTDVGLHPLVEDSDGRGGYHVWLFFDEPIPADDVYRFASELVDPSIEPFPKQRSAGGGYGSWLRLPGRHPRRQHWSYLALPDMEWAMGEDAAQILLDVETSDSALIPRSSEQPGVFDGIVGDSGTMPQGLEPKGESIGVSEADDWFTTLDCLRRMPQEVVDDYEGWLKIGMALHEMDPSAIGLGAWDAWSRKSDKWKAGACAEKWKGFGGTTGRQHVGVGTLVHMAGADTSAHAVSKLEAEDQRLPEPQPVDKQGREKVMVLLSRATGLSIRRWIQRCSEAGSERFFLLLRGVDGEIEIGGAGDVLSFSKFRTAVYAQAGKLIRVKKGKWDVVCRQLARIVEVEEIEEETRTGRLTAALNEYLRALSIAPEAMWKDAAMDRQPFVKGGYVWIAPVPFISWCRESKIILPRAYQILHEAGWQRVTVSVGSTTRSVWCIPRDSKCIPADLLEAIRK